MRPNGIWRRIRFKTLVIAAVTIVGLVLAVSLISSTINLGNLERLEVKEARENMERISRSVERETNVLGALAADWGNWDDSYDFVTDGNATFIEANMGKSTLDYLGLDFVAFFDEEGKFVYGEAYNPGVNESILLPYGMDQHVRYDGYLIGRALAGQATSGLLVHSGNISIICAHPLLTSTSEGPVHGMLLMGKFMDEEEQEYLGSLVGLPLKFRSTMDPVLVQSLGPERMQQLNETNSVEMTSSDEIMIGYQRMMDVYGTGSVVIEAETTRDIYLQGKASQDMLLVMLTFSIIIFGLVTIGLLETWVISRVSRLNDEVSDIAGSGDTTRRVLYEGIDEIGELGSNINGMIAALDQSQTELVDIERKAKDELEKLVKERTNELLETNRALALEVSERQRTEGELRDSESRYRAVVEDQMELIRRSRPDGTITFVNQAFARYYSMTPTSLLNTKFKPEVPREDGEAVLRHLQCISPARPVISYQHRVLMQDGSERWQHWTSRGIFDNSGALVEIQSVGRDLTDKIKLEQEMLKTQKLESLGRLAGGIAHDFNNILTSIIGNITIAKMDRELPANTTRRLMDAESSVLRAKNLTQQLLTFSEGGNPVKERTRLDELVRDAIDLSFSGTNVQGEFDLPTDLWEVEADRGQIRQVIHNLSQNAFEAMPQGGIVHISAHNWVSHGENGLPLPVGDFVVVEIHDDGVGIPKEIIDRIFDPFFTTKRSGSGLGLTAGMSIVRKHGGYMDVESELGTGSTFRIYLPAMGRRSMVDPREEPRESSRELRVLLMDDEVSILEVVTELLLMLDCQVECARDGQEALEMYRSAMERGQGFDLVIMDLTIPGGMGGKEAIRRLRGAFPNARAIVSSGYSNDPVMSDFQNHGFVGVLQKPYTMKELEQSISAALAAKLAGISVNEGS